MFYDDQYFENLSNHLTKKERELVEVSIGSKNICLASGVTKLFITNPPDSQWIPVGIGVVCLIKSPETEIHYLKQFCIDAERFILEEELYLDFEFSVFKSYFFMFQGKSNMVGLYFADPSEAASFSKKVIISMKNDIKNFGLLTEKKSNSVAKNSKSGAKPISSSLNILNWDSFKPSGKDAQRKKISLTDISGPTDFKHIKCTGVINVPGYSKNRGFNLHQCDDDWLKLFVTLKLNEKLISKDKIAREIINFVEQHGGIKKIVESINVSKKPNKIKSNDSLLTKSSVNKLEYEEDNTNYQTKKKLFGIQENAKIDNDKIGTIKSPISTPSGFILNSDKPTIPPRRPERTNRNITKSEPIEEVPSSKADDRSNLLDQITSGGFILKTTKTKPDESDEEQDDNGIVGLLAQRLQSMRINTADDDSDDSSQNSEWDE